jgi:hypothetical protein
MDTTFVLATPLGARLSFVSATPLGARWSRSVRGWLWLAAAAVV